MAIERSGVTTVRKKFALFGYLAIAIQLAVSLATAQTQSITIGKFTYVGTAAEPNGDGAVSAVSTYELSLDTTGITMGPISFSNVILFVKGTRQGSGAITTGQGCGLPPYQVPCNLIFLGGPSSAGFALAPCASLNAEQELTQNCISIAVQLMSLAAKNFSFALANGEQFCAYGINNTFLQAVSDEVALNPRCDAQGFCKGASVPIILHAAPTRSCSQ
jgi:hypothetical protein